MTLDLGLDNYRNKYTIREMIEDKSYSNLMLS